MSRRQGTFGVRAVAAKFGVDGRVVAAAVRSGKLKTAAQLAGTDPRWARLYFEAQHRLLMAEAEQQGRRRAMLNRLVRSAEQIT